MSSGVLAAELLGLHYWELLGLHDRAAACGWVAVGVHRVLIPKHKVNVGLRFPSIAHPGDGDQLDGMALQKERFSNQSCYHDCC